MILHSFDIVIESDFAVFDSDARVLTWSKSFLGIYIYNGTRDEK